MRYRRSRLALSFCATLLWISAAATAAERTEHFDLDPRWEDSNARATAPAPRTIRQDFGYSSTNHAGGQPGEIGGYLTPAAETAYYARKIAPATFDDPLSASGTLAAGDGGFHVLLGFFNSTATNEWRTPNSIAIRLNGRGDVFYAYSEYATARWRAGGDSPQSFAMRRTATGRNEPIGFAAKGATHRWTLSYDPKGGEGHGAITVTIGDQTSICHLSAEHRADGARFDRFGLLVVMKSADGGGELWLDDVTVNGQSDDFAQDPGWDARGNRTAFSTPIVRPRFDFGYSRTRFAGGKAGGELGGLVFRGDCRYPERMAHYADRLQPLSLQRPLRASGKVVLRRGVTDSGVLLGFFDSQRSIQSNPAQDTGLPMNFFGISTDAPSRDGFYLTPVYRVGGDARGSVTGVMPPRLFPDGVPHDWTFDYQPLGANGRGQITVTLDDQRVSLPLGEGHQQAGGRFDRFGIVTTWVDGNSQLIYFDDLTYTASQD